MKRLVRIFLFALLTGAFAITSCTYEKDLISYADSMEGEMSEISFLVDLPQTNQVATRAEVGSIPENTIDDIYVLVFDKITQNLISKSKGKGLSVAAGSDNNNKVTFKATLPVGTEYTFMVLANTGSKLNGIDVGLTPAKRKADVLALAVEESGKWSATSPSIPMWGEKDLTLTASSTPAFELTRMLARINVELNLEEISPGVSKDNFRLTSIRYYNYNTAGALVPAEGSYDVDTKKITAPTIPMTPGTQTGSALVYDETYITDEKSCKEKIYIFEAAHNGKTYNNPADNSDWINNPCLVIGGKYKTEDGTWLKETFYRVDFIRKDNTNPNNVKDIWLSVLRNFSYNVSINEVSGSGFEDADTALKSAPINMEANVLEWNEMDMGEIVFDGVFYLSVSQDQFIFQRNEVTDKKEDNILYVKTDYMYESNKNHEKSGWYVEKYVDLEGKPVTWLKLNPEKGAPNDRVEAYFTFETNTLDVNRHAVVWIAAGRLRYPVYITQRVLSLEIVDPDNNDEPVSEMRFVIPRQGDKSHEPRNFKVLWTPINESVSITHESPQVWNPFAPEWLNPNPSGTWTIAGGSGTQSYQVNAPTVDASAIALDPFYERETTYTFTVDNGDDRESKNITLHQIYYNIIVDTYSYKLDGKTYTLSVRSNTDWVITNIEEWLYNQDPAQNPAPAPVLLQLNNYDNLKVGTTGGPNTSGESVAFTVVNQESDAHRNKWGTVYVTFENPDNKFEPVRVALRFPPSSMTLLGLGYARDVRAYNPAFPSTYHLQGVNRMISAVKNFGNDPESIIQVEDFKIIGYNCEGLPASAHTPDANWWTNDFAKYLNEHKPDIIVVTYSMRFPVAEAKLLNQYLENGGAVIMYYGGDLQATTYVKNVMDQIFETTFTTTDAPTNSNYGIIRRTNYPNTGTVFQLLDGDAYVNDPILNGPFGDVRGKYWGTHYSRCGIRADLIQDKVHILSMTDSEMTSTRPNGGPGNPQDPGYINMFRHKTLNLFWVGNGMGTASYYPRYGDSESYHDPIRTDDDFRPTVRTGFGPTGSSQPKYDVYNSYIFANAVAWAISVTNHTPPVGGYQY